jgi:hypothetical protein
MEDEASSLRKEKRLKWWRKKVLDTVYPNSTFTVEKNGAVNSIEHSTEKRGGFGLFIENGDQWWKDKTGENKPDGREHKITRFNRALREYFRSRLEKHGILPGTYQNDPHQRDLVLIEPATEVTREPSKEYV